MELWIARDKCGELWLYNIKPRKLLLYWCASGIGLNALAIDNSLFPEVKWEDEEPRRVMIALIDE